MNFDAAAVADAIYDDRERVNNTSCVCEKEREAEYEQSLIAGEWLLPRQKHTGNVPFQSEPFTSD